MEIRTLSELSPAARQTMMRERFGVRNEEDPKHSPSRMSPPERMRSTSDTTIIAPGTTRVATRGGLAEELLQDIDPYHS